VSYGEWVSLRNILVCGGPTQELILPGLVEKTAALFRFDIHPLKRIFGKAVFLLRKASTDV
jgi:hypothetical protein